jgi:hypothetical protein
LTHDEIERDPETSDAIWATKAVPG